MKSWTKWIEDRTGLFTAYRKCSQSRVPAKPCCLGLWPGMILALALVYLFQVAPHGHIDAFHPEPHATHQAHADHDHAPVDSADDQDSSNDRHHHHSVTQHLDFHSVRLCLRAVDQDHGGPVAVAAVVDLIPGSLLCGFVAAKPAEPVPVDPLLLHAPSRAPPA